MVLTGPILESKGMRAVFQKKGKKMFKMGKIFENLGENIQNLKTFWKVASVCVRLSHVINCYNHGNDILWLFDVLPNFPFTTNETKCNY